MDNNVIPLISRKLEKKSDRNNLRREGFVPGVMYLKDVNSSISISKATIEKEIRNGRIKSRTFEFELEGQKYYGIFKDIQFCPVKDNPIHFDIYIVEKSQEMKIKVPVEYTHKESCIALKRGGTLCIVKREILLKGKAQDIPPIVKINLSSFKVGDSIHVNNAELPDNLEFIDPENLTIATIVGGRVANLAAAGEGESGEAS